MPRATKAVEPEVKEPKATKAVEIFEVVDSAGTVKRTFSVEKNGKEAEVLAESFAKKFGFKVK